MTINKKLVKIASRAAMTFTAHGRRKTHCGPGSDFDKFFAEILYVSN